MVSELCSRQFFVIEFTELTVNNVPTLTV